MSYMHTMLLFLFVSLSVLNSNDFGLQIRFQHRCKLVFFLFLSFYFSSVLLVVHLVGGASTAFHTEACNLTLKSICICDYN